MRDLLSGACLAAIGAALVWHFYPGFWKQPPVDVQEVALQQRHAFQAQAQIDTRTALAASAQPAPAPAMCDMEPLVPPGRAADGQATVEHPFPAGPSARAKVFLRRAEAAAANGRPRDAEVALLAACRENEKASARPSVPLARVLGRLGEHYAAAAGGPADLREQMLARARHAFTVSAGIYARALGPNASRTRQARERLAAMDGDDLVAAVVHPRQATKARAEPVATRPQRAQGTADRKPSAATSVRRAAERRPDEERPRDTPDPEPAAVADADPEFRQLASDLARLRAQAEAVSDDPAGFARRAEVAGSRRNQCETAACMRAWYAARRQELLAEF